MFRKSQFRFRMKRSPHKTREKDSSFGHSIFSARKAIKRKSWGEGKLILRLLTSRCILMGMAFANLLGKIETRVRDTFVVNRLQSLKERALQHREIFEA